MKLVVGLGNPGDEYEKTRHNTGRILVGILENKMSDHKIK
nr:aminoacyl-tRNA hydrolase [Candidatus Paceibacterota bacterium]